MEELRREQKGRACGYDPLDGDSNEKTPPQDAGYIVYFCMFYLGVAMLFPWNAFITASGYFETRFCGSSFANDFENYFSFLFTISQTAGLALSVLYQDRLTLHQKVVYPLVIYTILFMLTTILVTVPNIPGESIFYITAVCAGLCGICGAILSSGLYGLGAMLPPIYTGALMNGSGLAGLGVSIASFLTLWIASPPAQFCEIKVIKYVSDKSTSCAYTLDFSALTYFLIATLVLITNLFAFLYLSRLPFVRYVIVVILFPGCMSFEEKISHSYTFYFYDRYFVMQAETIHVLDAQKPLVTSASIIESSDLRKYEQSSSSSYSHPINSTVSLQESCNNHSSNNEYALETSFDLMTTDSPNEILSEKKFHFDLAKIKKVFIRLKIPSLSVILVYTVSIVLFPSLIVRISSINSCKSEHYSRFYNDLFIPLVFVVFNLFDFIGRLLAGYIKLGLTGSNIWVASLARVVFIPLLLLCNIKGSHLPLVFNYDYMALVLIILLALSNGFVSTHCMVFGALAVRNIEEAGLAGTIMIFSLTFGLLIGAICSFGVLYISTSI